MGTRADTWDYRTSFLHSVARRWKAGQTTRGSTVQQTGVGAVSSESRAGASGGVWVTHTTAKNARTRYRSWARRRQSCLQRSRSKWAVRLLVLQQHCSVLTGSRRTLFSEWIYIFLKKKEKGGRKGLTVVYFVEITGMFIHECSRLYQSNWKLHNCCFGFCLNQIFVIIVVNVN